MSSNLNDFSVSNSWPVLTTTVGIFGLGYAGIPLARRVSESGMRVIGFDINEDRVRKLNQGTSPLKHISSDSIAEMRSRNFQATCDFALAAECDALIICVPTPLNKYREPDLSFIVATMEGIAPHLRKGQLLSLESTTWPGTTEEVLRPYVTGAGLVPGEDVFLVYSPEREDPGNPSFETRTIPKIVGGDTPQCLEAGIGLYGHFIDKVVPVSSSRAAEMVKLLENIYRSVNIGLANEMKVLADRMNLDIFEVVDAAATKPFGFTPFYPGPGIGGHCIPVDPFYLTWKAREFGLHTRFIELAGEINAGMPDYVVGRIISALNARSRSLAGARVLVVGIAYKRDVDDMRESPSVLVMERLREWGARLDYCDSNVPVFPRMREHDFDLRSVTLSPEMVAEYDAVVLLTDHSDVDYDMLRSHARLLVDTRGRYRGHNGDNLVRA
ncbi:nucleotide sugar dehydrogenase (plasmid) [Limimaricola variabilis]|uniref:nucleotide sugar dehydrogenase n=1 Tax=Limimaricola variabilis TaxID=1492771 RepID=UPI002AC9C0D5|nr:nucleotide sugar dehydrogenase [Limimaricola variabilis]WPY97032.1 nucleotide sugar dehydrogenase [Limimaricola variabilis]